MGVVRISVLAPGDAVVTKDSYLVAIKPRHETGETRREEQGKKGFFGHAVFGASGATRSIRTILTP